MTLPGFTQTDFAVFAIDGLEPRMEAIRARIQPKFQALGAALRDDVAALAGREMHLHIAKHLRRKTNAPIDTWLAIAADKRGYKQHPHFQLGLFGDHLFVWFALIYELPDKQAIAGRFLRNARKLKRAVPPDYVVSFNHTKKDAVRMGDLKEAAWKEALERLRTVKSTELLVGRHLQPNDPIAADGEALARFARDTFATLMPYYELACR